MPIPRRGVWWPNNRARAVRKAGIPDDVHFANDSPASSHLKDQPSHFVLRTDIDSHADSLLADRQFQLPTP